ncbi:hypothetical protein E2562_037265 [Oryza meyeriana var. granulata]|uniref:Uncharacterized protein n=1 Tax=Oryza meyeriana var. granulata TaxID=110450 RepID=A0A6G1ECT2_9ORYZ|nr:hypothetical protein E2562_037265 [Oryza meyeriana var. granulata]
MAERKEVVLVEVIGRAPLPLSLSTCNQQEDQATDEHITHIELTNPSQRTTMHLLVLATVADSSDQEDVAQWRLDLELGAAGSGGGSWIWS